MNPLFLASGVPAAATAAAAPARQLPAAPPRSSAGLWDPGNRHKTLLALGAGFLSGGNFAQGLGQAGQNLAGLEDALVKTNRKTREFGGPDDAFEIVTDPRTGEQTVSAIPQFQDYLREKARKPKDAADLNGRAMYAIEQLPEKDRPAAYAAMIANPERFGIDPSSMPPTYDPTYGRVASSMGMTVAQAQTRAQAASNAADMRANRDNIQADRTRRTDIYEDRAHASTAQGEARIAQGAERIAISRANAGRKGGGGGRSSKGGLDSRYEYRVLPDGRVQKRLKR